MPWTASDAKRHTHEADSPHKAAVWAHVANQELRAHGDEGRAIRVANAAVARIGKVRKG